MKMGDMSFVCCICGKKITGWGNNPWPVDKSEDARCCDTCNITQVIPARLAKTFIDTTPKNLNKAINPEKGE